MNRNILVVEFVKKICVAYESTEWYKRIKNKKECKRRA